ncbi:hypothetical protein [Desulforhopalus sp. 52FAK]
MKKLPLQKCLFFLFVPGLIIGFVAGQISANCFLSFEYTVIKSNFKEAKTFIEVLYFFLASLLLPLAYFQYIGDKDEAKKGDVQYAHKLYQIFVAELLPKCDEYTSAKLQSLNTSNTAGIKDFNQLLNDLDAFSAAFVHGIADSESGKAMFGEVYCDQIKKFRTTLSRISPGNYRDGLENTFTLFDKWSGEHG